MSGLLADGSSFEFDLNPSRFFLGDFFDTDANVTVTLTSTAIPEPGTSIVMTIGGIGSLLLRRRRTMTN